MKEPDIVYMGSRTLFGDKRFAEVIGTIALYDGLPVEIVAPPKDITTDRPLYEVILRLDARPEAKFFLELITKSFARGLRTMWQHYEEGDK